MQNKVDLCFDLMAELHKNTSDHIESLSTFMDKRCGKTALQRQIKFLRQQLLELSILIDKERRY